MVGVERELTWKSGYPGNRFLENARQVVIAAITVSKPRLHVAKATAQAEGAWLRASPAAVTWITKFGICFVCWTNR